jgi:cation diffusion facilitator CzcD-associated flavoprotein CzcO
MMDRSDRICIVGAGAAGLAAAKNLAEFGFEPDVLEKESDLGGIWNYDSPAGRVYRSTHTISSKPTTQYPDFPMPDEYPDYPHHSQMLEYLRAYATRFGLDRRIEYLTPVEQIEPASDNDWIVTLATGEKRRYGAVVIANGHNWDPKYPNLPGEFHGQAFHSAWYRTPDLFTGKRVLVIGAGNSGCDIAVDAVKAGARQVMLSMRRGYHILPKFIFGRPVDQIYSQMLKLRLPLAVRRMAAKLAIWLVHGSNRDAGLPEPDHRLFETHPLVNQLLPYFVRHGRIEPKPDVTGLEGTAARFSDGSREEADILIYATGYRLTLPFLDSTLLNWENGRPGLHLNLFHPEFDTLFVAGLIQPNSGEIFLLHWQSRAIALFLRALESGAPAADWLRERKRKMDAELSSGIRYSGSPRHSLEVEQGSYYRELMRVVNRLEMDLDAEFHKEQEKLLTDSDLLLRYKNKFGKKLSDLI